MENNTKTFNVLMANLESFHGTFLRSDIKKLANQIDQANSEGQIDCLVIPQGEPSFSELLEENKKLKASIEKYRQMITQILFIFKTQNEQNGETQTV